MENKQVLKKARELLTDLSRLRNVLSQFTLYEGLI